MKNEYPNGITIRELKIIIKDLPEEDENGELFELWMYTGVGLSSPVTEIWKLNQGDLIVDSDVFKRSITKGNDMKEVKVICWDGREYQRKITKEEEKSITWINGEPVIDFRYKK